MSTVDCPRCYTAVVKSRSARVPRSVSATPGACKKTRNDRHDRHIVTRLGRRTPGRRGGRPLCPYTYVPKHLAPAEIPPTSTASANVCRLGHHLAIRILAAFSADSFPGVGLIPSLGRIVESGPLAGQAVLCSLRETEGLSEEEGLKKEMEIGAPIFATKDAAEGPRAFKEKRKPVFTGT